MIFETIFEGLRFPTCRPAFLNTQKGRYLELDGYCDQIRVAFEYQGQQHYDPNNFFNRLGTGLFAALRSRDERKLALCEDAGVRLVVVPYMVKDRWAFIRFYLLRWFPVSVVNPIMLTAGPSSQAKGRDAAS